MLIPTARSAIGHSRIGRVGRPDKVREGIEYFKIAYEIWPDIVGLNQIALGYEMIGEAATASKYFEKMLAQAEAEHNGAYLDAAQRGLEHNQ